MKFFVNFCTLLYRHHFFGSVIAVAFSAIVMQAQLDNRTRFAGTELYEDVMDRWGTPIYQAVPSVRYIAAGSVFTQLSPLPFDSQNLLVHADMNYRKRGLVYFSGFDFSFHGKYSVTNPEESDIDLVFVLPISLSRNRTLLSELNFLVDGEPIAIGFGEQDKLVWTGHLDQGQSMHFDISYKGRGLDRFSYNLDPALPVRNFTFQCQITGGDSYDYAAGVVPAGQVEQGEDRVSLLWDFPALESGVPVGVTLPSVKSRSEVIATMVRRSVVTFMLFFGGLIFLAGAFSAAPKFYETYLIAFFYAFTFVLMAYLAAFFSFATAYLASVGIAFLVITIYTGSVFGVNSRKPMLGLMVAFLLIPTMAVIFERYTGLIYTLEILAGLIALMKLTTHAAFKEMIDGLFPDPETSTLLQEEEHAL